MSAETGQEDEPGLEAELLHRLPSPHLPPKQPFQLGSLSFVSDKGVLLFTLQASVLVKCFLVIYWRVDEATKENDRVLFFLIHFNVWVFVFWWQLQGSICLSPCTKCWRKDTLSPI